MEPRAFEIINGVSVWLATMIGIFGVIAGVAGAWAVLRYKVKQIEKEVGGIADFPTKYVLASHCLQIRREILDSFCKKIDEVKSQLHEMDKQREVARVEFERLLGRLERILKSDTGLA